MRLRLVRLQSVGKALRCGCRSVHRTRAAHVHLYLGCVALDSYHLPAVAMNGMLRLPQEVVRTCGLHLTQHHSFMRQSVGIPPANLTRSTDQEKASMVRRSLDRTQGSILIACLHMVVSSVRNRPTSCPLACASTMHARLRKRA